MALFCVFFFIYKTPLQFTEPKLEVYLAGIKSSSFMFSISFESTPGFSLKKPVIFPKKNVCATTLRVDLCSEGAQIPHGICMKSAHFLR